jgi:hypothetical protein
MPMKNPPHPGDFVRTEIIKPAGLSVTEAAAALHLVTGELVPCFCSPIAQLKSHPSFLAPFPPISLVVPQSSRVEVDQVLRTAQPQFERVIGSIRRECVAIPQVGGLHHRYERRAA